MFKYMRDCLPKLYNKYYIRNVDIHSQVTHQQNILHTYTLTTCTAQNPSGFYEINYPEKYVSMSVLHIINEL